MPPLQDVVLHDVYELGMESKKGYNAVLRLYEGPSIRKVLPKPLPLECSIGIPVIHSG